MPWIGAQEGARDSLVEGRTVTSTAQARMEEVIAANPRIGRVRLEKLAGVSQAEARAFLQYKGKAPVSSKCQQIDIVGIHDLHVPYHDKEAVSCAFNFCEQVQPTYIVLHEWHDFYSLSRFSKDPARKADLQYELDLTLELLRDLRKRCPGSKMIMLKANHTDRLQRYLWNEAPALSSLRSLRIEEVMGLAELDIDYMQHFIYKDFLFKHGSVVRKDSSYTAKAELLREGMSGASGHTHRLGAHYRTLRGGSYVWIEGGCLCDLNPEYMDGDVANWQHGFSVVTFEKEGHQFYAQTVPIIDGKLMWGGEMIAA